MSARERFCWLRLRRHEWVRTGEAATEANEAMRAYNRNGIGWPEYDATFARLEAALARLDTTKGER